MFADILSMLSGFFHMILGIGSSQSFPPPLPAQKEKEYFALMEKGDATARRELILHNLRLVSHIVRKYYASAKNQEDLVSIGTLGLIKAVDSFHLSNGAKFATYAAKCIQNEILMHFRSQKKLSSEVSINETIDVDRDGNPLTYIDVLSCEENMSAEVERKMAADRAMHYVSTILDARERQIIVMRYGLGRTQPMTQREIAQKLNISRSYVSRIEKGAIEKLSDAMKSRT